MSLLPGRVAIAPLAAVLDGAPLVTRDARHFSKVPGLSLARY